MMMMMMMITTTTMMMMIIIMSGGGGRGGEEEMSATMTDSFHTISILSLSTTQSFTAIQSVSNTVT